MFTELEQRLQAAFRPEHASDFQRVYQLRIGQSHAAHLIIDQGRLTVVPGRHEAPSLTVYYPDTDTALGLLEGDLDPMEAFMAGHWRSDGHLIFALQLTRIFGRHGH